MKTARKAALTFMLPASLLMSVPACAGNLAASDPPRETPAAREDRAEKPLPQGITTVILAEASRESLLEKYPFLRQHIDPAEMSKEDRESTRYYQKTVKDAESKTDLLFVSAVGPYFCGTEGCTFYIFRSDGGKPHSLVKSFNLPHPSISMLKEGKNMSLIAGASDGGQGLWTWGGDKKYHYSGPYVENPKP